MKMYVWKFKYVCCVLAVMLMMTGLTAAGITALLMTAPKQQEDAVAVFAMSEGAFSVETMEAEEAASIGTEQPDQFFRVEVVRSTPQPEEEAFRILIYHSHTWEAYQQVEGDRYTETEKWRTRDDRYNVVAVGEALAAQLRALGCTVMHDTTAFEPPDFEQAYARSLSMLEERMAFGEEYDLYIDLHRDAIASNSTLKRTVNIGGIEVARFMMLIGKGTGAGFDVKPDWEANLVIAQRITEELNGMANSLCRDVKIKTGRFNQHVAPRCVLIECGNNLNTLEQVMAGVPYLAQAIVSALAQ